MFTHVTLNLSGDTWGITGSEFLRWYLVAGIAAVVLSVVLRVAVVRSWAAPRPGRPLSPTELGMLVGERRAVAAALAWLRADGVIDRRGVTGYGPRGPLDPLTTAVHDRISAGSAMTVSSLWDATGDTLDRMRSDLLERRILAGADYRRAIGLCGLPVAFLVLIGVIRLVFGFFGRQPIGYLVILILLFTVVGLFVSSTVWQISEWTTTTPSGSKMLTEIRESNGHLRPEQRPSYATYGSMSAAMSVALFGPAALSLLDPEFAAELGMAAAVGGSAGVYGGGGSCGAGGGSGSGCGGGGCGG